MPVFVRFVTLCSSLDTNFHDIGVIASSAQPHSEKKCLMNVDIFNNNNPF